MCTLTWHRGPGAFRVYFNRDERRTRPPGLPPRPGRVDGVRYVAPRDSEAGGTWIAAARGGLVLALLNGYVEDSLGAAGAPPPAVPPGGWISRGHLIERAIAAPEPAAVSDRLEADGPLDRFRTFVLIALHPLTPGCRIEWLDGRLRVAALEDTAMPISSSSFETVRVLEARRRVWRLLAERRGTDPHATHLAFHRGTVEGDGAASVCMARPDAQTVSFTWIDIEPGGDRVRMHYLGHPPCRPGPAEATVELGPDAG